MTEEYVEEVAEEIQEEVVDNVEENESDDGEQLAAPEEKVTFDERQQEVFNSEISKKVGQTKKAERENAELRARIQEFESRQPKQEAPTIPPMPDAYDEDFASKVAARDTALRESASYDLQQRIRSEHSLQQQNAAKNDAAQKSHEAITSYVDRGEKLGHKREDVIESTQYLMDVGLGQSAQAFIRDDTNGPDVARYLARNPQALAEVAGMNDHMAIAHIASIIKPKAMSSFRKQNKIPEPTDHLRGRGAAEGNDGPPGATFT